MTWEVQEHMTRELAEQALSVIGGFSKNLLPVIFNAYQVARPENRAHLMACTKGLLSIAPPLVRVCTLCSLFLFQTRKKFVLILCVCR